MKNSLNEKIKRRYNRISKIYSKMDGMINKQWRISLLEQTSGDVLEVGIGTGSNFPYYPEHIRSLTGIDFSPNMLKHAKDKVANSQFTFPVKLIEADIQKLPFQDNTFNSIISTCVFCSVPNPIQGLQELRRVCKPNGRIYMLEHMRSEKKQVGIILDLLNPITVRLWGANINRDTLDNIKKAGLEIHSKKHLMGTIMREIVLTPAKDAK